MKQQHQAWDNEIGDNWFRLTSVMSSIRVLNSDFTYSTQEYLSRALAKGQVLYHFIFPFGENQFAVKYKIKYWCYNTFKVTTLLYIYMSHFRVLLVKLRNINLLSVIRNNYSRSSTSSVYMLWTLYNYNFLFNIFFLFSLFIYIQNDEVTLSNCMRRQPQGSLVCR